MNGRTCIVTGANAGIGYETALGLARLGARVVMVCRNPQKAERAMASIREKTGNDGLQLAIADLSVQASVRELAAKLLDRLPAIHVLVNNAGLIVAGRKETADGVETTFAVNHLAGFLLTDLLLERLQESAPARIVNVSSAAHQGGHIDFDDLEGRWKYSMWGAYGQSKLANVLFTYELARRLEGTRVTANGLHPGFVRSKFAHNNGLLARGLMLLASPAAISPKRGARTSIYLASSPEVEGVSGRYFASEKPARSNAESHDEATARRLWVVSEAMTSRGARPYEAVDPRG